MSVCDFTTFRSVVYSPPLIAGVSSGSEPSSFARV